HQLIDMNTMAINALNMPELKFDTYGSKEIKNLIQFNLIKSQAFLNTTLQMRTNKDMYEMNIMLLSFFMSNVKNIETMAKMNRIKLNVQTQVKEEEYVSANPYILQLVFASLASSVIKLSSSDSMLLINLQYENDTLTYRIQNEMPSEEEKFLKKILIKYTSNMNADTVNADTYEFEIIHKACKLYDGDLSIKPVLNGASFTAKVHLKHLNTMIGSDIICTESFYAPALDKDKTPIPIKLPFSYIKEDPISIFIAEDNLSNISYFKNIFQEYGIIKIYSTGLEAWNSLNECHVKPDIIIAEYNMPMLSGFELFKKCSLSLNLQNIPFIMILQSSDYNKMHELYAEGVSSCITKPFSTIDFFNKLSSVLSTTYKAKNSVLNQINRAVIKNQNIIISDSDAEDGLIDISNNNLFEKSNLSPREKQIAILISVGRSDKEIAEELNISPATVATHNKNIFKKLSVHSRIELIKKVQ
nr:LuxR C-terminal-related transcriptional regulator [Treponema sp.]